MATKLSSNEKALLYSLQSTRSKTIISLRPHLAWDVSRFITTVIALEERQLLQRDGSKLIITSSGIQSLRGAANKPADKSKTEYLESSERPQLPVNSLYLPDYMRFLQATKLRGYTRDVSPANPE